ncbi:MAG: TIGR00266 family protein, partial [Cyclobacteriaceae bacterium]|nr:TIGR00266 family protein [Cyclobacteriaceae bacterium]
GETLIVAAGGFVAKEDTLDMNVGWQGMASLFSGEGLFWLKIKGSGKVLLNSFGSIYTVDVHDHYIVDTSHIVAFEETLQFQITKGGNTWLSAFLGGEGFVCKFQGKGKVFCQSHNPGRFGTSLSSYLLPKER